MSPHRLLIVAGIALIMPFITKAQQNKGWRQGEMEAVTRITTPEQSAILYQLKINADMPPSIPGTARLYLIPDELKALEKAGIIPEITIGDLNSYYAGWWDRDVPPGYYTYQQILDIADSLANAFPDICQKTILGISAGDLQLVALKISDNVTNDEPEPEIMFEAGIHGDEVGGPENLIRFARDLCKGYGNNTQITDYINSREIWLWLMVNPDGRQSMSRYNDNYVDINRDAGYMWNGEGNSPGAWSQPETKTMRDFCTANQFVVFTDYHSGTEFISYPWSYRADEAPDEPYLNQLASIYASTSGYTNIPYAQGYSGMYPINGSTKDFNYGSLGSISWSIEISMNKQPPSSSIYSYYMKNKPAMLAMIGKAGLGIQGTITDSLSGMPVPALIWVDGLYPCANDPVVGDYHKYLTSGTYSIKITASGYQSKTFEGITVPLNGTFTLDASLRREADTAFARKVLGCYILNNNPNDEGFTPGAVGPADNIRYSLGKNGWVILDMGDTIVNKAGNDITVIEDDGTDEGFTLYAGTTADGPWTEVGTGTGTTSFDLNNAITKVRYLKIKDAGQGSTTVPDAGFDVDAVMNLHPAARPLFSSDTNIVCAGGQIQFADLSRGTPQWWHWDFEGGTPASSTEQYPVVNYNTPGSYKVTLAVSDGFTTSVATRTEYITVLPVPDVNLGADTLICYDYQHVTLDAGNPGSVYQWSTGETTQTILTQCSGIDITDYYSVSVTSPNGCSASDTIGVTCTICETTAETEKDDIQVYPNPAKDILYLSTEKLTPEIIIINDISGRVLSKTMATGKTEIIRLTNYKPGIYFMRVVVTGSADRTYKIVKI